MKRRPQPAVFKWSSTVPWRVPSAAALPAECSLAEFCSTPPVSFQFDCFLTGISHASGGAAALEAAIGDAPRVELCLERERENAYDPNALVVQTRGVAGRAAVGHVAGAYASVLSPLLDAGLIRIWLQARRADVVSARMSPRAPMQLVGYARLMSQAAIMCFHDAPADATESLGLPLGAAPVDALVSALKMLHLFCFRDALPTAGAPRGTAAPAPPPMILGAESANGPFRPLESAVRGGNAVPPPLRQVGFVSARALAIAPSAALATAKTVSESLAAAVARTTAGAPSHDLETFMVPQSAAAAAPSAAGLLAASSRALKKAKQQSTALQSAAFGRGGGQQTLTGLSFTARQALPTGAPASARLGELVEALPASALHCIFGSPGVSLADLLCSCRAVCRRWRDTVDSACSPYRVHWVRDATRTLRDTGDLNVARNPGDHAAKAPPRSLHELLDAMSFRELPSHVARDVWRAALPAPEIAVLETLDWEAIADAASGGAAASQSAFAWAVRAGVAALPMLSVSLLILRPPFRAATIDVLFRAATGRLCLSAPASDLDPGLVSDALYRLVCALHAPEWALAYPPLHIAQGLRTEASSRGRGDGVAEALEPGSTMLHRWYCSKRRPPVSRAALDILAALRSFENPCVPAFVQRPPGSIASSSTAATGPRGCIFTEEQLAVIAAEPGPAGVCKVVAYAGTGKTTTLAAYARARLSRRFLYLVFNVSIREEAAQKFPPNVEVTNVHRLAFSAVGWKYGKAGALRPALSTPDAIRLLGLGAGGGDADANFIAAAVVQTLDAYFSSGDAALGAKHLPSFVSDTSEFVGPSAAAEPQSAAAVLSYAERLWGLMRASCDAACSTGAFMTHAGYLKLYQLSRPDLAAKFDVLLCDEAQDLAPVAIALVVAQRCPVILVGDPHQAIYGFLGAQDALASAEVLELRRIALGGDAAGRPAAAPSVKTLRLTRSFRFGAEIAAAASILLRQLKDCPDPVLGRADHSPGGFAADAEPPVVLLPLAPSADPRGGDAGAAPPQEDAASLEAFERRSPLGRAYPRPRGVTASAEPGRPGPAPTVALLARSNAGALEAASSLAQRGVRIAFVGGADGYGLDDLVDLALLLSGDPEARGRIKGALVRSFESGEALRAFAERVRDAELGGRLRTVDRWGGPQAAIAHVEAIRAACAPAKGGGGGAPAVSVHISTVHKAKGLEFDEARRGRPRGSPRGRADGWDGGPAAAAPSSGAGCLRGAAVAEAHLLYVAVTRARARVWLNATATHVLVNCGGWLDSPERIPGLREASSGEGARVACVRRI